MTVQDKVASGQERKSWPRPEPTPPFCRNLGYRREPSRPPPVRVQVPLYFFDTRDNDHFIRDDVGLEFPSLETVKRQAALSLAELAHDVLPGSVRRVLSVEVRDQRQPILIATMTFEAIILLE